MKPPKKFARDGRDFKPIAVGFGSCIASDRITVDGALVGYMYKEEPDDEIDSGWRFFAGDEDDEYVNDADKSGIYDVNTIANYDPAITPHLECDFDTAFERVGHEFRQIKLIKIDDYASNLTAIVVRACRCFCCPGRLPGGNFMRLFGDVWGG